MPPKKKTSSKKNKNFHRYNSNSIMSSGNNSKKCLKKFNSHILDNNKLNISSKYKLKEDNISSKFKLKDENLSTKKMTKVDSVMSCEHIQKRKTVKKGNIDMDIEKKEKIDIKEFLSVSFDENDFDDVMDKEKRTFCKYFSEKFQENQIFINSFFVKEPLRPKSIKILVLISTIELYFIVNALFYTEEYLSEIFYIDEKDSFFAFAPRRINHFIYIFAVIGIISYIIGYFFIEEKKIKKMFLRNKEGDMKLKYEISMILKDIKSRFTILISIIIFISIIGFIYISCFNNVYPNSKEEWIKSSLFIIIVTQLINLIVTFAESLIRYIAIKCNSEKLFKLSLIFL